ncbi:MAG: substrate-binding domain-containing protein [Prochloraceae cyanobacterium]|nr:substrate-binding domain-containing protein [Prochloraceae cyanobacterium]
MKKLVVLKLNGNWKDGFSVALEMGQEGKYPETEQIGYLPANTSLITAYKEWRSIYRQLEHSFRLKDRIDNSFQLPQTSTYHPVELEINGYIKKRKQQCTDKAQRLKQEINHWLESQAFRPIDARLRENLSLEDEVRFLIRTPCSSLTKLPWHLWNLLDRYSSAEITVAGLEHEKAKNLNFRSPKKVVKILAVLGNSLGIDLEQDKKQLIQKLPQASVTFLCEPSRQQLNNCLWEQSWDILFFAGHSQTEDQRGRIHINQTDSLTIDEISSALKKAIDSGLQLAIFNSCEGLGIASSLQKLHLPHSIVMREPVPDLVAQKFLNYFLTFFASGKPLHLAVRSARERLEGLEYQFPCASWLPTIYQNPAVLPLTWSELLGNNSYDSTDFQSPSKTLKDYKSKTASEQVVIYAPNTIVSPTVVSNHIRSESYSAPRSDFSQAATASKNSPTKQQNFYITVLGMTSLAIVGVVILATTRLFNFSQLYSKESGISERSASSILAQEQAEGRLTAFKDNLADVTGVPRGHFRYGGSTTWAVIRDKINPSIESLFPQFHLIYTEHPRIAASSGVGVQMLLQDQLTFAQTSRPLKPSEYERAEAKRYTIKQIPIAIDGIAFAVNPSLNIPGLTVSQLKDIYTGKIVNWKEVGGPDLQILPLSKSAESSGTAEFFVKTILRNKQFGDSVKIVADSTQTIKEISANRGAIFFASAPEIVGQCSIKPLPIGKNAGNYISPYTKPFVPPSQCPSRRNSINNKAFQQAEYPLTRYLYVIIKENGSFEEKAGKAYVQLLLTKEGQKSIQSAGFVPMHISSD